MNLPQNLWHQPMLYSSEFLLNEGRVCNTEPLVSHFHEFGIHVLLCILVMQHGSRVEDELALVGSQDLILLCSPAGDTARRGANFVSRCRVGLLLIED